MPRPLVLAVLAAAQGRTEPDVRAARQLSGAVFPRREERSDQGPAWIPPR